jgi:uncharacterized protein (TIGR03086 family)
MTTTTPPDTDPRPSFAAALAAALDVIAAVRPGQLDDPTPCTDFDVRHLLGHLVAVLDRVDAAGRGADPFSVPHVVEGVPDDGWTAAATTAARQATDAWADDEVLHRLLRLPFGTLPGAAALATYVAEISTHTWDLAVATGQTPAWDPAVLAVGLAAVRGKLPSAGRGPEIPFADAVPVTGDAPLIDQLVGWQGRDPGWTAPA